MADDTELAEQARSGDPGALSALVKRYHGALLRVARSLVRGDSVAEEVVQDTWVAVLDGVERFEGRSSFKTWLFRILANRAATRGAREARSVPLSSLGDGKETEPAVSPDRFLAGFWKKPPSRWNDPSAEKNVQNVQIQAILERELDLLPQAQKSVVVLRDVEGLEPAEVCAALGISEANQRVLLHRGRSRLRTALERHLGKAPA
jgi:RNA polymerase sigma-70 factor, ECF subfamily